MLEIAARKYIAPRLPRKYLLMQVRNHRISELGSQSISNLADCFTPDLQLTRKLMRYPSIFGFFLAIIAASTTLATASQTVYFDEDFSDGVLGDDIGTV